MGMEYNPNSRGLGVSAGRRVNPPLTALAARHIAVSVSDDLSAGLAPAWLERVLRLALAQAFPPDTAGQVSLLLTDDAAVQELNRVYRGLDETTDVLSFSPAHPGTWMGDAEPPPELAGGPGDWPAFVLPPEEPPPLGEVIISYPQARRQAIAAGRPVARELAWLVAHGVLHLAGYDHLEPAETAQMQALEQAALARIFPPPQGG